MDLDLDPDPWNWSVEDVQSFFRNTAASYIADTPGSKLPPLDPFLAKFEENEVSGSVLLNDVDALFLRDDCGIAKLSIRASVNRCIKKLRDQSAKYAKDQIPQPLRTSVATPVQALATVATPQASPIATPTSLIERTRSAEVQIQDSQGKKRRRLDLSKLEPVQADPIESEETANDIDSIISPTGQDYFGKSACPIEDLFFGKTKLGKEVGDLHPDGDIFVTDADRQNEMTDINFQFTAQGKPVGESRYVYKQVRHFLVNDGALDLKRNDRPAVSFAPYREGLSENSVSALVLQFQAGQEEPVAIREDLEQVKSGKVPGQYTEESTGEWGFLVEKHKTSEDQLLPAYGDSDDEDVEESLSTTDAGLAQYAAEEVDDRVLSKDRVAEIVDDAIKGYISDWQDSREELEKKQAWSVWNKMKKSRQMRDLLINGAQARVQHYTARLNKMTAEFMDHEWRSEKSLVKTCDSLEVTVQDREYEQWCINIWKRRQEPYHAVRHGTKNGRGAPSTPTARPATEGQRLHIDPNDRLSVEPSPNNGGEMDIDMEEEIRYEADDEEPYHTPAQSPEALESDYVDFIAASDEVAPGSDGEAQEEVFETGIEVHTDSDTMPLEPPPADDDNDSSFSPAKDESPESDDLPSPSTFVKNVIKSSSKKSQHFTLGTQQEPLDLTLISSDSSTPVKKRRTMADRARFNKDPLAAAAGDVAAWDKAVLIGNNDRMRLLIKMLYEIGEDKRERLHACLISMPRPVFNSRLRATCQKIKSNHQVELTDTMSLAAAMCIEFVFPTLDVKAIKTMPQGTFESTLSGFQILNFANMLSRCLEKRKSSLFIQSKETPSKKDSSSAPIEVSSDTGGEPQGHTPHKKRKRAVARSQQAENSRTKALQRERKLAESQTATNSTQLANMVSSDPSSSAIVINPAKDDGDDPIYICDRIARKMKTHQIDGVRFLWREVTANDDDGAQGCVLAHTMGLGKTMQTIALLVAVNEATRSKKKAVNRQIPSHLRPNGIRDRNLRMLILCPPALIQNWQREIRQWAPNLLGLVFSLDSGSKGSQNLKATHLDHLENWMRFGGVVLVGYQRFRDMMLQKPRSNQKNTLPEEQQARIQRILRDGPEIVVADEAHNLKNIKSKVAVAAAAIKTHSRIGLTGTPMSNDIDEIYALISWVAPGYLGGAVEFQAHYAEPIKAGIVKDSTPYERRRSLMKLKVLHSEIQPKVNRATIEVLRGSLQSKVEFVITVPLGETQTELYKRYIQTLLKGDGDASQVRIFGWLGVLALLTNHPRCFRQKLLEPPKKTRGKKSDEDDDGDDDTNDSHTPAATENGSATPITTAEQDLEAEALKEAPADKSLTNLGLTPDIVNEILDGYDEESLADVNLSAKVNIFLTLLKYSLACKDKVLLFSGSIPTLEYLDELLTQEGFRFGRIDGSTRMQKRTEVLEDFHNDDFHVMLVSTRAGGVGLNIQGANRVFIFDFGFNPAWEEQAIGRAYRLGQIKPVYVYRFVAGGTFESNIYNKQLFKTSLSSRVVDQKNPRRNATRDVREYLYEPRHVKQEDLNEEIGKDAKVLDRLLEQHGPGEEGKKDTMIRVIKTMETLQEEVLDEELNEEEQREVNMEIEQGRNRPKGQRAMPPPSSARLPMPQTMRPGISAFAPPPSTYAGPSNFSRPQQPPLGGSPMPRTQQPHQR